MLTQASVENSGLEPYHFVQPEYREPMGLAELGRSVMGMDEHGMWAFFFAAVVGWVPITLHRFGLGIRGRIPKVLDVIE